MSYINFLGRLQKIKTLEYLKTVRMVGGNIASFLLRTYEANKTFYKTKKIEQIIKSQRLQLPKEMISALRCILRRPAAAGAVANGSRAPLTAALF